MANAMSAEDAWCASERQRVIEYLQREQLVHGEVGEWPAWHVWPHVAVWAVESATQPGWVGWWAISGDVPMDYTSVGPERHPREGARDIAKRWRWAAAQWREGKQTPDWTIGSLENERDLAQQLSSRADLLLSWVEDDALWPD